MSAREDLKRWRNTANITQGALGELLGVTQEFVCQLETGRRPPGLRVAAAIEKVTGGEIQASSWVTTDTAPVAEPEVA